MGQEPLAFITPRNFRLREKRVGLIGQQSASFKKIAYPAVL